MQKRAMSSLHYTLIGIAIGIVIIGGIIFLTNFWQEEPANLQEEYDFDESTFNEEAFEELFVGIISGSSGGSGGGLKPTFQDTTPSEECTLSITPKIVCRNDFITGKLTEGKNTNCSIFANDGSGWRHVINSLTDNSGIWQETHQIRITGDFTFIGFCDKDKSNSVSDGDCYTNIEELKVIDCTDDEGEEDIEEEKYTCGVTSFCQAGTCPKGYFCQRIDSLFAIWCACVTINEDGSGGQVHPDWNPDGENYNPNVCTDTDGGYEIYTQGTCTDIFGNSFTDYCATNDIGNKYLVEYICEEGICVSEGVSCPFMNSACTDGACWDLRE